MRLSEATTCCTICSRCALRDGLGYGKFSISSLRSAPDAYHWHEDLAHSHDVDLLNAKLILHLCATIASQTSGCMIVNFWGFDPRIAESSDLSAAVTVITFMFNLSNRPSAPIVRVCVNRERLRTLKRVKRNSVVLGKPHRTRKTSVDTDLEDGVERPGSKDVDQARSLV